MRECENCGCREFAKERAFKRCSRCKIILYCSEDCQKAHWPKHKKTCKPCEDARSLPKCGLCGNRKGPFMRTECCDRLVCDDEDSYRLCSYSRIHCARNHRRYTICGSHYSEGHKGKWQNCVKCKRDHCAFPVKGRSYYEWASRAGNPPHLPFKFNFDEDAIEFNWDKLIYLKCSSCRKKIDTVMDNFSRSLCPHGCQQLLCDSCTSASSTFPAFSVVSSMDKY